LALLVLGRLAYASLADQLVNAALRYRGQGQLLDSLLKEIGLTSANLADLRAAFPELGNDSVSPQGGEIADEHEE
jgi:hypothetical protein